MYYCVLDKINRAPYLKGALSKRLTLAVSWEKVLEKQVMIEYLEYQCKKFRLYSIAFGKPWILNLYIT